MGLNRVSFKSGSKNVKFDYNSSYKDKIKKGILQPTMEQWDYLVIVKKT